MFEFHVFKGPPKGDVEHVTSYRGKHGNVCPERIGRYHDKRIDEVFLGRIMEAVIEAPIGQAKVETVHPVMKRSSRILRWHARAIHLKSIPFPARILQVGRHWSRNVPWGSIVVVVRGMGDNHGQRLNHFVDVDVVVDEDALEEVGSKRHFIVVVEMGHELRDLERVPREPVTGNIFMSRVLFELLKGDFVRIGGQRLGAFGFNVVQSFVHVDIGQLERETPND